MKYIKALGYLILLVITTPLLWWLGRDGDSFEGETFSDYNDDDYGDDVDEED